MKNSDLDIMNYKGFQIRAAAFCVPEVNQYLSSLQVVKWGHLVDDFEHFSPRCWKDNGLFQTASQAIDAAFALGKTVVDGKSPKARRDSFRRKLS